MFCASNNSYSRVEGKNDPLLDLLSSSNCTAVKEFLATLSAVSNTASHEVAKAEPNHDLKI